MTHFHKLEWQSYAAIFWYRLASTFLARYLQYLYTTHLSISLNKCSARQCIISCITNKLLDSVSDFLSKIQDQRHVLTVPEEAINVVGEYK